ncbi:hypothetical protein [Fodinicola acaciae]|uniref:hypothetical protein n=1 Tax=Fodinicola acaciae TaxID=2681555 RepID=UPI0013D19A4F|nr:hypothetical protein [Fodinicola acaciae]
MTGWQQVHRRTDLLNAVLEHVSRTGSPQVPAAYLTEIDDEFGGLDDFLLAVHQRWSTAFAARLDAVLEESPEDLPAALARLHTDLAAVRPALRAVLDNYHDNKALAAAEDRQWRQLVAATGVRVPTPEPVLPAEPTESGCFVLRFVNWRIRRVLDMA